MILYFSDGTTTVWLSGQGGYLSRPYHPTPAQIEGQAVNYIGDGGGLAALYRRNVQEQLDVKLLGTAASMRSWVQDLEKLLNQAAINEIEAVSDPVYLYYSPDSEIAADAWRTQILFGQVHIVGGGTKQWNSGAVDVVVGITRRFYWEDDEVNLSLVNTQSTGSYGLKVQNANDSTYDNYVTIAGSQILGSLPAPFRLEFTHVSPAAASYHLHYTSAVWGGVTPSYTVLESEDADVVYGSPASVPSSACSGGFYKAAVWTGDTAVEAYRWDLSTAALNTFKGRYFRILARFQISPSGETWYQPKIRFPAGTPLTILSVGDEVLCDTNYNLQDFGVMQIPPWLSTQSDLYGVALSLYARKTGGATTYLDCIYLFPVDGYRQILDNGYGISQNVTLVDDMINGVLYTEGYTGSTKSGHMYSRGGVPYLWPGKDTAIYFAAISGTGTFAIDREGEVVIAYRPRRATI